MHENILNDEHIPHEGLQNSSIESSQLMPTILPAGVCFFFSIKLWFKKSYHL